MAFDNLRPAKPAARRTKKEPIFGVGWHAFVNWPHPADPVPLVGAGDAPPAGGLVDGQEVEILSWRPRARDGLAYQIRRLSDGHEFWILALHLRRQRDAQPAEPVAEPT